MQMNLERLRQRARIGAALAIGVVAFLVALWTRTSGQSNFSDFDHLWIAARALMAGQDPYAVVAEWGSRRPLYYPLPAVLIAVPFAWLPMGVAYAAFTGLGMGVCAFALASFGWWPLMTLLSFGVTHAITLGQWSLLASGIAALPWLAWLVIVKPTTAGAVALAHFPATILHRRNVVVNLTVALALVGLSLAIHPTWPLEWRAGLRSAEHFTMPAQYLVGAPLLLAVLRWRRTEARLLFLLALAPQSLAPYDAAPLALVVRTRIEALAMVATSLVAQVIYRPPESYPTLSEGLQAEAPVLIAFLYLPALVMVLRRPNESETPSHASTSPSTLTVPR